MFKLPGYTAATSPFRTSLAEFIHTAPKPEIEKEFECLSRDCKHLCVIEAGNRFDKKKRTACFDLEKFNAVLEKMTRSVVEQAKQKWWCMRQEGQSLPAQFE